MFIFKSPRVHLRAYVRSKYIHVSTCLIIGEIVGFYKMYFLLRSIRQPLNFILVFSKEAPRLIIHTRVSEVGIRYVK
jgi:hypothetical protein